MTMSVSSLKTAILSENNPTTKDGCNYSITLNNKKYSISTESGTVVSAKRDREGVWDKIKSAVCDFFGISTSKRLVKAYNAMIAQPKIDPNEEFTLNKKNQNKKDENVIPERRELTFVNNLLGDKSETFTIKYSAKNLEYIKELGDAIRLEKTNPNVVRVNGNVITYRVLAEQERNARDAQM